MRVLQIINSTNINSGIAQVIMNFYRGIDRTEVQFDFLLFGKAKENFDNEIKEFGGNIYYFTKPGLTSYFDSCKDLDAFFRSKCNYYDIVHCNELLVANLVFKYAKKYGSPICISHSHGVWIREKAIKKLRNRLATFNLVKNSDRCFACSQSAAEYVFGKGIVKNCKYKFIPNVLDINKYKYCEDLRNMVRTELGVEDKFVLGNTGRLNLHDKNQLFAVDVLAEILKSNKNAVLVLVGAGPDEEEIRKYVEKDNLQGRVILMGLQRDIKGILSAMDYYIFPSNYEGFGLSLLEAQVNGLPCICFDNMPKEVIINKVTRMDVKSKPKDWAYKIASHISGGGCRDAAMSDFNEFNMEIMANQLLEKYKEALVN